MQASCCTVVGQERAVANARAASTELSRLRVEREEVELFLVAARHGRAAQPERRARGDGPAGGARH